MPPSGPGETSRSDRAIAGHETAPRVNYNAWRVERGDPEPKASDIAPRAFSLHSGVFVQFGDHAHDRLMISYRELAEPFFRPGASAACSPGHPRCTSNRLYKL